MLGVVLSFLCFLMTSYALNNGYIELNLFMKFFYDLGGPVFALVPLLFVWGFIIFLFRHTVKVSRFRIESGGNSVSCSFVVLLFGFIVFVLFLTNFLHDFFTFFLCVLAFVFF